MTGDAPEPSAALRSSPLSAWLQRRLGAAEAARLRPLIMRFLVVGAVSAALQVSLLVALEALGVAPVIANTVAVLVTLQFNFVANLAFVWRDTRPIGLPARLRAWAMFHVSVAGSVVVNIVVFALVHLAVWDVVAVGIAVACSTAVKFIALDRVALGAERERDGLEAAQPTDLRSRARRLARHVIDERERYLLYIPPALTVAFLAVTLLPEVTIAIPNLNDDSFHFLLARGADKALSSGQNPIDYWSPGLELGFPQFLYYQHLPHLTVVLLDRLLLRQVDLFTMFNLTRYALLVTFPVTVYWSVRRLGFSRPGAAAAATLAPLLAGKFRYGFEYDSYLWRGFGMYTQLWAMHLSFVSLALFSRALDRGRGYTLAVAALSALVLAHLVYAYMMAITAGLLLLSGMTRQHARERLIRFLAIGAASAVVTSYFWLPFILSKVYLNASPLLQRWKYDSFGAREILTWLAEGDLWDHGRLPVFTALVVLGAAVALWRRSRPAILALALFVVWLLLYFGRPTWGALIDLLPLHEGLIMHRFIGGVDIGAILLVAVAGEWVWNRGGRLSAGWRAPVMGVVILLIATPALMERSTFFAFNRTLMHNSQAALARDGDARTMIRTLQQLPPGRTYAGLPSDWGARMLVGELHFNDLLVFNDVEALSKPYQSVALSSEVTWYFDYRNLQHYRLFNVRYLVAPSDLAVPQFLSTLVRTPKYTLYQTASSSYFDLGRTDLQFAGTQSDFHAAQLAWMRSTLPAAGDYPAFDLGGGSSPAIAQARPASEAAALFRSARAAAVAPRGRFIEETASSDAHGVEVDVSQPSTLVLKVTYHPNWEATIDGQRAPTFMVMPSYVGVNVTAGRHVVEMRYRSRPTRTGLFFLGAAALLALGFGEAQRRHLVRFFPTRPIALPGARPEGRR